MGHISKVKLFVVVGMSTLLFSLSFAFDSTYAASYVNVSSGGSGDTAGVVSLGKIKPSSSGSTATGNDTLTVHTDCSSGYKVYVSGQNGKTTNLTNQSATDPSNPSSSDIISASSNTIASPNTLSSNTWGISGSSTDIENHLYAGLPAYADSTNVALVTKTNVEEESTVPIYYGVNANTAINPGTYSGDILYTVLMDTSCIPYTVEFSPNVEQSSESEITGEMTAQSILPNSATALTANAYKRSGYAFLGWSESADGKTGNVTNGVGTEADVDYTNGAEVNNLTTGGAAKTLYAIWIALDGTMQNFAGCSTLSSGDVKYLRDTRDDTNYRIKKIGDECWMTSNLILGHDKGYALTSELTNIPSSDTSTYYFPMAGRRGSLSSASTIESSNTLTPTFNGDNEDQAQVQYRAAGQGGDKNSTGTLGQSTGYYNFWAASLGYSGYGQGSSSGSTPRDICPKGWQLPINDSSNSKSWYYFYNTLNKGSHSNMVSASGAGFLYSGNYYSSQLYYVGTFGYWWSSTVNSNSTSYGLYLNSSGTVYPQNNYAKSGGFAVRCVAQSHYTVTYNANSGTGTAPAAQAVTENGSVTTQANTFTRDGYNFLGWSTNASATTADYPASSAQNVNDIVSAAATSGQTITDGSTITLYAVWEKNAEYMQDFMCSRLSPNGETKTLVDKRDGQEYTVYRIPTDNAATDVAGKCIMTKDLNLGAVNSVSGSSSTITANGTMTLSPEDSTFTTPSGSGESITVPTSNVTVSMTWNTSDSYSNRHYHTNGTGNYAGRGYYSWGAAIVACPKGWRLPTQDELNNNDSNWNASTTGVSKAVNNNISTIQSSPWSFVLGGLYSNGFINAGSGGYYWSSTQRSSSRSYYLFLGSSYGLERDYDYKSYGFAVRCMADDNYDGFMQSFDTSTLEVGQTVALKDKRDDAIYTVKKFSDGTVWMTSNLILGHDKGYALTNELTNIPSSDTSTYYFPMAGRRGSLSSASTIDSSNTATPTFDINNENQAKVQYRAAGQGGDQSSSGTLSQSTGYYNFWAASLGYSGNGQGSSSGNTPRDICPKGWQLPLGGSNTTKSWVSLDKALNGSSAGSNRTDATARNRFLNEAGFLYSGEYLSSQQLYRVGSYGYWWSSTVYNTNYGYILHLNSSGYVYPQDNRNKSYGLAVRCVAK